MTHDHVIEKLPWLVNGTLAEGERSEVEEHLAGCPDCRAELALTRDAFLVYSTHLPPAVLVVYAETPPGDRLTIDGETVDRRSVDAHLAHCDDCREELEMVRESRAFLGAEEVAPAEDEAVLPFVRPPAETAGAPGRGWMPVALAASLLLAMVLAGGWWFESQDGSATPDDRRAEIEELERDLDEARRQLAAARSADPGAAAAADAEARVQELEAEVAGLNEATGALREQVAGFEAALTGPRENVWYAAPTPLDAGAVRGGEATDDDDVELVPAGVRAYLPMTPEPSRVEGVSEADYRVLSADGEVLYSGRLRLLPASELAPPYFGLELPTADLPDGTITVELTAGERRVGRYAFRVEG